MADSIENKIVSIQFDNRSFEQNMAETIRSLQELTEALEFKNAGAGFADINAGAESVDLSGIGESLDFIKEKFTALGVIGITTLANLTTAALDFAKNTASNVLEPIMSGGMARALNLEQAQFLFRGIGIDVEKGMASALEAVKGTAFGLDEAAKIAAQFGAAGIQVGDDMTRALSGVAGAAALTGSSFSEIGDIFASSAAIGKVTNQDLQQFATRGLNAGAAIGKVLGKTQQQVAEMAREGKLDFKTFSDAMAEAFGEHSKKANETFSGALDNMHAAMSRLGASFIAPQLLIRRDVFNAITPQIDNLTKALKPLIDAFVLLRRILSDKLIGSLNRFKFDFIIFSVQLLQDAFIRLYRIVKPIVNAFKAAFREFFPINLNVTLVKITAAFDRFVRGIKIGAETFQKIRTIFRGFFAALSIGFTVIKELAGIAKTLATALFPASSGLLDFGSKAGGFLINLQKSLVAGGGIHDFFIKLGDAILKAKDFVIELADSIQNKIADPIESVKEFARAIQDFFSGDVDVTNNRVASRIQQIGDTVESVQGFWDKFLEKTEGVREALGKLLDYILDWFSELGDRIAEAFKPGDFEKGIDLINVGLLGGILLLLRKFVKDGLKIDIGKGLVGKIEEAFGGLTDTMKAMQAQLRASVLKDIAVAIALLTASLVVLSLIDSKALTKALVAISVSFAQLMGSLALLDKLDFSAKGILKFNTIGTALIVIASALVIFAAAVKIMSTMDAGELARGLTGITVSLAAMIAALKFTTTNVEGLITAAAAMTGMAGALILVATAVRIFGTMSVEDLAKGLAALAISLGLIVIAMKNMPVLGALEGVALIGVAIALNLIAGAVALFGNMNLDTLAKGLGSIGVALLAIAGTMHLMPKDMVFQAGALILVAVAMNILAAAVESFGGMKMGELAKGLGGIGVALLILAGGLYLMQGALLGAAALGVAAIGLTILAEVLKTLGSLSVAQIITGLLAMAAAILVIGGLSLLLAKVTPFIFALGASLAAVGGAFILFGAGVFLFAKGMETLAKSGVAGAKAFIEMLGVIGSSATQIAKIVAKMGIEFISEILGALPLLIRLIEAVVEQLIVTLIKEIPKLAELIGVLIQNFIKIVRENFPGIVSTGFAMIMEFLRGIRDNISEIVAVVAAIIVGFLTALAEAVPSFVESIVNLWVTILTEVARGVGTIMATVGPSMALAFMQGFLKGLEDNFGGVFEWFGKLPGKILDLLKSLFGIKSPATTFIDIGKDLILGLLKGLVDNVVKIMDWFLKLPGKILGWIGNAATWLVNVGSDIIKGIGDGFFKGLHFITDFFTRLPSVIRRFIGDLVEKPLEWLKSIGDDIIHGLAKGISAGAHWLKDVWNKIMDSIPFGLGKRFKIDSPSRLMMWYGEMITLGLAKGLKDAAPSVRKSMGILGDAVTDSFDPEIDNVRLVFNEIVDQLGDLDEFNPTITPVLDLSQVKSEANTLKDIFSVSKISPEGSLAQARIISALQQQIAHETEQSALAAQQIIFNQTNNSPEALSTNDIYRNTKSQIVLAKEKLGVS